MKTIIFAVIFVLALFSGVYTQDCKLERCTRDVNPVCGFNGMCFKLFNNDCLMRNHNCETGDEQRRVNLNDCSRCCL